MSVGEIPLPNLQEERTRGGRHQRDRARSELRHPRHSRALERSGQADSLVRVTEQHTMDLENVRSATLHRVQVRPEECTVVPRSDHRGPSGQPVDERGPEASRQMIVGPTRGPTVEDLNDKESRVAQKRASSLAYHVLEEINVRPNVTYLAKVRNTHPSTGGPGETEAHR